MCYKNVILFYNYNIDAENVYVDIGTQQLVINATTCIAAHSQDAGPDCMEASVSSDTCPYETARDLLFPYCHTWYRLED